MAKFEPNEYRDFDEMETWLQKWGSQTKTKLEVIGHSSDGGHPIYVLKINIGLQKPIIFIEAGAHAREWISPAVALGLIDQLMTNMPNMNGKLSVLIQVFLLP